MAHYLTVRAGSETVGYAGIWLMVDEAHVTTFAVLPGWRRRGIGGRLMLAVMRPAATMDARVSRRSRFGCRTCPRGGCTSSSASSRSASARATTRTTARTR